MSKKRLPTDDSTEFVSNPFSTGGGGVNFELQVQTSFVALMLAGGFSPCLPCRPIHKVKLQGKYQGYNTDDLIVFTSKEDGTEVRKLFGQIKHKITITESNTVFKQVIRAAWKDFSNESTFSKDKDVLALITGPLSAKDIEDVRTILEWARHSESAGDFFTKVETANFSSDSKRLKLKSFQLSLLEANDGKAISNDTLYSFLRHYHILGYDLDIRSSVMHAILHSLIGRHSPDNASGVWSQILQEVMFANQNAGTIEITSLPNEISEIFKKTKTENIPEEFLRLAPPKEIHNWNTSEFAAALVVANLLGSWNEKSASDMEIARKLCDGQFETWLPQLRKVLQLNDSPLTLRNGIWNIKNREELWKSLGPSIFDRNLDILKECALEVFKTSDPQFDLAIEERYAASIYGKVLPFSENIRKGLAETLAILGSFKDTLVNCSLSKAENTSTGIIREVFLSADWTTWGTLNLLLPLLAEASPKEFLYAVDNALVLKPSPFELLFKQEGSGIIGRNYITGLLWALETLAWCEDFLVNVTIILGSLDTKDPGGQWANRPLNSLVEIYLPWLPQTTASIEKRKVALQTLSKEYPESAGKLLLKLMPDHFSSSSHTHKPVWRKFIPEDWREGVSEEEYRKQVSIYSEIATNIAISKDTYLLSLIPHLDHFPEESFLNILRHISSKDMLKKPENAKRKIWEKLTELTKKHRMFHDTDWAMPAEIIDQIEHAASNIKPQDPTHLYQRLFSGRDWDLYEEKNDWQEQQKNVASKKKEAIRKILDAVGFSGLIEFSSKVESAFQVGFSLGLLDTDIYDEEIIPKMINSENIYLQQFAEGFVKGRFNQEGYAWADKIIKANWSLCELGKTLTYLPFGLNTWQKVEELLGPNDSIYWEKVSVNPYEANEQIDFAIKKLIENKRPWTAVDCLARVVRNKEVLDNKLAAEALIASAYSTAEITHVYDAVEVIKTLQSDPSTSYDDIFKIEWLYLQALRGEGPNDRETSPKILNTRLSSDPTFFNEVISTIYKSDNLSQTKTEEPSENQKAHALNAYRLLQQWKIVPGTDKDGKFSGQRFKEWVESAISLANTSGHLDVTLVQIGNALTKSPSDPDGLWLHRDIADVLNRPDMEDMRRGYSTGIHNSRGVHWVDPTGAPELNLAKLYRDKAEIIENAGYHRIADTLRDIADSYEAQAKRIVSKQEDD